VPRRRDLRGAGVVVFGASSGIGRALAELLAEHGARLVLAGRDPARLRALAERCQAAGAADVAVVAVDLAEAASVGAAAEEARARLGIIDVWVNVAAVLVVGDLPRCPDDEVARTIATNVTGTVLASRAAMARFDEQGAGTLINVASLLGVVPTPLLPVYTASKFAVRGLTLALQQRTRADAIRVCLVLPGPVDTPMFARAANHTGRRLRAIPPATSPWRVAATIVRCAQRPRSTTTTGLSAWSVLVAHRLAPSLTGRAVGWASSRLVVTAGGAPDTSGAVLAPDRGDGRVSGGWRRGRRRARLGDRLGRWWAGVPAR